jgi:hypothetical protein
MLGAGLNLGSTCLSAYVIVGNYLPSHGLGFLICKWW